MVDPDRVDPAVAVPHRQRGGVVIGPIHQKRRIIKHRVWDRHGARSKQRPAFVPGHRAAVVSDRDGLERRAGVGVRVYPKFRIGIVICSAADGLRRIGRELNPVCIIDPRVAIVPPPAAEIRRRFPQANLHGKVRAKHYPGVLQRATDLRIRAGDPAVGRPNDRLTGIPTRERVAVAAQIGPSRRGGVMLPHALIVEPVPKRINIRRIT